MSDEEDPAVDAAWAYEGLHVDALFRQWAAPMLDAATIAAGFDVLDIACGTGVLAREALTRVGTTGAVTGLDANAGMLAVAQHLAPGIRWIEGDAGTLPFDDAEFDAVVCQFGLMFFEDRRRAVLEMLRCARPGAPVAAAVWDALERSAAFATSVDLLEARAGSQAADALRAPFVMGDPDDLGALFEAAGASSVSVVTHHGTARFPSVRSMVEADLRGWLPVMGVDLGDDLIESIVTEAEQVLDQYVTDTGEMVFDAPAHILSATAP